MMMAVLCDDEHRIACATLHIVDPSVLMADAS